jgi:hypothetical protein
MMLPDGHARPLPRPRPLPQPRHARGAWCAPGRKPLLQDHCATDSVDGLLLWDLDNDSASTAGRRPPPPFHRRRHRSSSHSHHLPSCPLLPLPQLWARSCLAALRTTGSKSSRPWPVLHCWPAAASIPWTVGHRRRNHLHRACTSSSEEFFFSLSKRSVLDPFIHLKSSCVVQAQ